MEYNIGKIEDTYNNLISKIADMTENDARAFLTEEINKSSDSVDAEHVANVVEYIMSHRLSALKLLTTPRRNRSK